MKNYLTSELDAIQGVAHGFFTRQGGVSGGIYNSLNCGFKNDDKPENVAANRARVAETLGLPPSHLLIAKQVHGIHTERVTAPWDNLHAPEADALVTNLPGLGLGILTADCVPILLAATNAPVIGAAHAGWRGAQNGIIESVVTEMEKLGAERARIHAVIGPCIGANSYEVKDDYRETFMALSSTNDKFFKPSPRRGHWLFNLPGYVTQRLHTVGVKNVSDIRQDTLTGEASFFSNRRAFLRSEKHFGLQVSVIALR